MTSPKTILNLLGFNFTQQAFLLFALGFSELNFPNSKSWEKTPHSPPKRHPNNSFIKIPRRIIQPFDYELNPNYDGIRFKIFIILLIEV